MAFDIPMSGHSKWAQIKHQKGAADSKRGQLFGKLARNISVAAREGKDLETNFKLRLAIDKAKAINMPHDTIERALLRGAGELAGQQQLTEVIYEAYGPAGSAFIIIANTDNKNRTTSQIRHILSKHNGAITETGSVGWNFEIRGVIKVKSLKLKVKRLENFELQMIDLGVVDIKPTDQNVLVYTFLTDLQKIKEAIVKADIEIESADIEYVPKNKLELDDEDNEKVLQLISALEEEEEVVEVFSNVSNQV